MKILYTIFVVLCCFTYIQAQDPKIACKYESVSSEGFKLARVTIPGALQVLNMTLVNQYSNSPCTPGASFGYSGPDIFASNGCRGNFLVCYEVGVNYQISCASQNFKETSCFVQGTIKLVTLRTQVSGTPCTLNLTYRYQGSYLIVYGGCRGVFNVGVY
ncbi:lectin ADEL-like [Physella acuta]|uniref:lectin ADEL-like n=1 Tax=Physella acuta TaxID=109671 RepID=UPI0027DC40C8|nr:lectin ADEL-like [Physella acuta]